MGTPNIFGGLRKTRLFNPTNFMQEPESDQIEAPDYKTPMLNRYRSVLDEYPNRANYKNPLLQKILAGIAGVSTLDPSKAVSTYRGILDEPYNRDVGEFGRKATIAKNLADIESEGNTNNLKRFIDIEKLKEDRANNVSLQNYRSTQGEELRDRIRGRSPEALNEASNRILGREQSLIPIREGSSKRLQENASNLTMGRERALFPLRENLANATHRNARMFDIENPLPVSIMPSQEDNAMKAAIRNVLLKNSGWQKFMDKDTGQIRVSDDNDTTGYDQFQTNVRKERDRIISQATRRNPLNNDVNLSNSSTDKRQQVIDEIRKTYPDRPDLLTNEAYIQEAIKSL